MSAPVVAPIRCAATAFRSADHAARCPPSRRRRADSARTPAAGRQARCEQRGDGNLAAHGVPNFSRRPDGSRPISRITAVGSPNSAPRASSGRCSAAVVPQRCVPAHARTRPAPGHPGGAHRAPMIRGATVIRERSPWPIVSRRRAAKRKSRRRTRTRSRSTSRSAAPRPGAKSGSSRLQSERQDVPAAELSAELSDIGRRAETCR
jgi:hypothetical protein